MAKYQFRSMISTIKRNSRHMDYKNKVWGGEGVRTITGGGYGG